MTLLVLGVSLYPMYRDDLAKLKLRADRWLARRDADAEALAQVQREISLLEHGAE